MSNVTHNIRMVGGRDHTFVRLTELGMTYSAFQTRALITEHLLDNAAAIFVLDDENIETCINIANTSYTKSVPRGVLLG